MSELIWHERPELKSPILIAAFGGWSDAQEAATGGVRFLIHELRAKKFAEIDPDEFYSFARMRPMVYFDDNGDRRIRWPANEFYYWRNESGGSDIIFFAGLEPHFRWRAYNNALMEVVDALKPVPVIVAGALLDGTPHTRIPGVTGSASTPQLREILAEAGVMGVRRRPNYQGPTGISSVFIVACQDKGVEYANLWGRAPHYLQISPNPKVSHSLIQALLKVVPLPVDLTSLRQATVRFDQEVAKAVEGNEELLTYVRRLEHQYDEGIQPQMQAQPQQPQEELPPPDAVLRDVEEFLRRQQPGDQPGGEGGPKNN
jgi:proteasome assembly chaperone (PAC2) family protein